MNDGLSVKVGDYWFVWGKHQEVVAERRNPDTGEREVLLVPVGATARKWPWVAAWRVVKCGVPSDYYNSRKQ